MIPYELPPEIVEEYRRILILTRSQYDEILSFLQNEKMWKIRKTYKKIKKRRFTDNQINRSSRKKLSYDIRRMVKNY